MTSTQELEDELRDERAFLDEAAARWLEAKAAGVGTEKVEAELAEHEAATRRLERRITRRTKGARP